jgi:hypothetical protein
MNSKLTATAGEHFVVYSLSRLGYIAAVVREGSQSIDILASTTDGSRTVGIQVKTTSWAERTRGRGDQKAPAELQFPLGHKAVEISDKVIFCFVDLRGESLDAMPDVYVIPAKSIQQEYQGVDVRQWSFFRLHRPISYMAPYKNNWKPIQKALS